MSHPGLDPEFWRGRRVLVTGHTGFKGAWTALWLHRMGAHVTGLALPPEDGSLFQLLRLHELMPSHFVDLRDAPGVAAAVVASRPELVLHMAAQPLVNASLTDPIGSFAVNVLGSIHLLEALRAVDGLRAVLVVTTDKVYANDEQGRRFRETDRLGGDDPYSASKSACEIATVAMARSFLGRNGIAVATARGGNVIGGGDFTPGRLVPDLVRSAQAGAMLTLRDPEATRPWQHVMDCICGYLAYLAALDSGRALPPALNFGPRLRHNATVGVLATAMLKAIDASPGWVHAPEPDRQEHHSLALDSRLARQRLGWSDRLAGRRMIALTGLWYRAWTKGKDMRAYSLRQLADYEAMP